MAGSWKTWNWTWLDYSIVSHIKIIENAIPSVYLLPGRAKHRRKTLGLIRYLARYMRQYIPTFTFTDVSKYESDKQTICVEGAKGLRCVYLLGQPMAGGCWGFRHSCRRFLPRRVFTTFQRPTVEIMEYWTSANDARRTYTGDDGEQLLAFNDGRMGRLPDLKRIHALFADCLCH